MKIKIGTRKSKLALIQTQMVADEIRSAVPDADIEIVHISTTGDKILDKPINEIGGKRVFVTEIESALQNKTIDLAVHSAKDLPVTIASGLEISGVLRRGDYRDALVVLKNHPVNHHSEFVIGTGSLRRQLNLKRLYPNARFKNIRGNVDTRLKKLINGEYDAILLAMAGLERMGYVSDSRFDLIPFEYTEFLPAPCQGTIAIESRINDFVTPVIKSINDEKTFLAFETERYVLNLLDTDCGAPLGVYACVKENKITLALSKDGVHIHYGTDAAAKHFQLAKELAKL